MGRPGSAQDRLNQVVGVIAASMVAEVCSVYLLRGRLLELFATEGLNPDAVHETTLQVGEGLVGLVARDARQLALSDAQSHENFAYRPETGEEEYHSLMGVPIMRAARVVGVLVVQNRTQRHYSEDEIEAMQTVAMILAEMVESLLAEAPGVGGDAPQAGPARLTGVVLNEGLGRGNTVLHEPRVVVEHHVADDAEAEGDRLTVALEAMREQVEGLLRSAIATPAGEPREILEAYRMFAHDRGWISRLHAAISDGLTAEAAVERVQVETRARMAEIDDAYLRERLHDLEDLANRLLRTLAGRAGSAAFEQLPEDAVIVARNMGPAELLDYDPTRLRAVVLEESSPTSHVAIVARALQVPVVGRVTGLMDLVDPGDAVIVDGDNGQVFLRPGADVQRAFSQSLALREARQARYAALRDEPAVTRDGAAISLNINAGLLVDLPHLDETAAAGIGLYRTELHFMVRATLPNVRTQTEFYGRVLDAAGERPVLFRTLDVGGDKILPYLANHDDENPAMGWRAIRLSLDRPVLLRMQLRALLKAAAGRNLNVMFPMIAEVAEFRSARALLEREIARQERLGEPLPTTIRVGTMLEVPSLAMQLPALLPQVDFVSIGSNDLMQFLFASDRSNPRLAGRYDLLSPPALTFLRNVVQACDSHGVAVSLCGVAAGRPLEAMALIGVGLRNISMPAVSVGPVKMMIRSLDLADLTTFMDGLYSGEDHSLREKLATYAEKHGVTV